MEPIPLLPLVRSEQTQKGNKPQVPLALSLTESAWSFCHTPCLWSIFGGLADCGRATLGSDGVFRAPHRRAGVACASSVFSWAAGALGKRPTEWGGGTLRLRCGWSLSPPTREWLRTLRAHDGPARPVQGHLYTPALEMDRSPSLRRAHAHLLHLLPLGWGLIGVSTPL